MAKHHSQSLVSALEDWPDRFEEFGRLMDERCGNNRALPKGKRGDDDALILWAYLEIVRLRGRDG